MSQSKLDNFIGSFTETFYGIILGSHCDDAHHFTGTGEFEISDSVPNFFLLSDFYDNFAWLPVEHFTIIVFFCHLQQNLFILATAL